MKVAIILGTRPEIIKMAPIIRELTKQHISFFILHTGQHYSYAVDRVFFEELELSNPKYNLEVGSGSQAAQTAKILVGVEKVLQKENPELVLVQGDTNSTVGGVMATAKLPIKLGHVEAGLRSYDLSMPEEINRIIADHCCDFLFAPTSKSKDILREEGISEEKIFITGNTIVDVIYQNLGTAKRRSSVLQKLGLNPKGYFLATLHRQENVDNYDRFSSILDGLKRLYNEFDLAVIYPIHPRSRKMMKRFKLSAKGIKLIEPMGFFDFLQLESNARLILTDSGGVQEEACILTVPCVTLRDNTERPETIEVGSNILAGTSAESVIEHARLMLNRDTCWSNPFGDGTAAEKILNVIRTAKLF